MQAAFISTWERAAREREHEALQVFAEAMTYWDEQIEAGKATSREVYFSLDGHGMLIAKGTSTTLHEITESDEFRELQAKILLCVDGVSFGVWSTGEAIDALVENYGKAVANL